jgi:site-specific recombinase XerD
MEVVMLEQYFVKASTIDRIRACWLAPQIEGYVEWMHAQGYADRNVFKRVPLLCHFADFTRQHGITDLIGAASRVEDFVTYWAAQHALNWKSPVTRQKFLSVTGNPVRQMLRLALEGRVTVNRPRQPFLLEAQAPGFIQYLRAERGLQSSTIYSYLHHLNWFAGFLKRAGVSRLGELSPALLASFVVEYAPRLSPTSRVSLCCELRVFLRFCHRERIVGQDLRAAVEMPQVYRLADVPRSITWDEVRRMLETVDRRTICGRRDYAILLLLVTYGLRGHEVAKLTLDDIDWEHERLRIPERKAGHSTAYPLASVVAEALIDYLKHGRPETADRHMFFRMLAPQASISNGAVSSRVAVYLQKAGIKVHRPGAHTLRHTCVQRLIDAEFPLKTIGDYIGHRSSESTRIYTKVALASLREVAMGDGEAL